MIRIIADKHEWDGFLDRFPPERKDVYFSYDYHHLFELNGDGSPRAAIGSTSSGALFFYPFLRTPIPGTGDDPLFDIQSAYGYGGPLVANASETETTAFEQEFLGWCRQNRIVAEFVRFHPLLMTHEVFRSSMKIEKNRVTISVDISDGMENVWKRFSSNKRSNVRKARKAGLTVSEGTGYDEFFRIYSSTMKRVGADPYYFFRPGHLSALAALDSRKAFLLEVRREGGEMLAGGIFLFGERFLHYHLGGSREDALGFYPNDLMMHSAMEWGVARGLVRLHMGGGTTGNEDDPLLRFKRGFSPDRGEFLIGKRVHDADRYDALLTGWERARKKKPVLFLQYHY